MKPLFSTYKRRNEYNALFLNINHNKTIEQCNNGAIEQYNNLLIKKII